MGGKSLAGAPDALPSDADGRGKSCARRAARRQRVTAMARMRQIDPELCVSNIAAVVPFRRPEDFARYVEGLRKAGLPEE